MSFATGLQSVVLTWQISTVLETSILEYGISSIVPHGGRRFMWSWRILGRLPSSAGGTFLKNCATRGTRKVSGLHEIWPLMWNALYGLGGVCFRVTTDLPLAVEPMWQTRRRPLRTMRSNSIPYFKLTPVKCLKANHYNPNRMTERQFLALKSSIHENGFCGVILARDAENGLVIVDGEHRWRAARALGIKEVPCLIGDFDELQAQALTVKVNQIRGYWSAAGMSH